jgi:2-amino-4-hydroxy-6-hydroxymethyldihydropteridine diphosphokinase
MKGRAPASSPAVAYIAIGANLGDPQAQVRDAIEALALLPGTRLITASSVYRTAPVGADGQPDYFNAVACIDTQLAPRVLLEALLDLESRKGRFRSFQNAPRTLDLDLLIYGNQIIDEPGLIVPHPRMHLRRFVLDPLLEIAPDAVIPGRGAARGFLAAIADQAIQRQPAA